jgi:hypothetical protein
MLDAERLIREIKTLPDDYAAEVLDFVGYLKEKAAKRQGQQCRDTQAEEPRLNAETRAAIAEGKAMLRGETPAKWYNSLDEMLADLDK